MVWIYQAILWLALPLVWVRLKLRARREPAYGERRAERFGNVPAEVRSGPIWFHTVSAGESIAAAPVVRALAEQFDDLPVLVTTMTPTGSAQVVERLGDVVDHCYAPYDFSFAVERFYRRVAPRALILMETELWPNLIAAAARRNIPVYLINARLSARSARGYGRIAGLTRPMLERLTYVACQSEDHRERFIGLGLSPDRIAALGSVKYDVTLPDDFAVRSAALRGALGLGERLVWIAASTHPGEDEQVLDAYASLKQSHRDLCLLLVPRHPHRAEDVASMASAAGWRVSRQSEAIAGEGKGLPSGSGGSGNDDSALVDVVVGDVMGTLLQLYGVAHVAFVGGSLVPVGGHNPLEPALCNLPIASGPEQFNFTEVMQELEGRGGLVTVADSGELADVVGAWLADPQARADAGARAAGALAENRGATARVLGLLTDSIRRLLAERVMP